MGMGMLGTTGILKEGQIGILGYDFTPYLPDLWYNDHSYAPAATCRFLIAPSLFGWKKPDYRPISQWRERASRALTGHPGTSMDIGTGTLLSVSRSGYGLPHGWPGKLDPGRCRLDVGQVCLQRHDSLLVCRRNANEIWGAAGHGFTFDEMEWGAMDLCSWTVPADSRFVFLLLIRRTAHLRTPAGASGLHVPWWLYLQAVCRRLSPAELVEYGQQHVAEVAFSATAHTRPIRRPRSAINTSAIHYL